MNWPQRNVFRSRLNYWAACGSELASPLLRVYTRSKVDKPPTLPTTWRKALLIGANHIGDLLYRSSSLSALKEGLPQCEFDFVAPAPACDVLVGNPCVRKIHAFDIPWNLRSPEAEILRQEKYDAIICYDNGMFWRFFKFAVDLSVPNRVGYVHKGFSAWITFPIFVQYPQPFPAYFRDIVAQLINRKPDWDLRPMVYPTELDQCEAKALWKEFELRDDQPVLACFVTTRQPTGVWPLSKFIETLRLVKAENPTTQIILCGASSDAEKLTQLRVELGLDCSINAGRLGLRALVAFLKKCRAVLSTDSGPRHLANAAETPVVYLRNLRSSKIETGNYLSTEHDLAPDVEYIAPDKQSDYLNQVESRLVAEKIKELLASP